MTVRLSGTLSDVVAANIGENVSEYIRDLIRRDKERADLQSFERLKAKLNLAFAAPESSYTPLTASDVIVRNQTPLDK